MGNTTEDNDEWKDRNNHKGFDITANRVIDIVNTYLAENCSNSNETVFWITGHSRGAAVGNIIGAKLEDNNYKTFAYTFASPNTTTSTNISSYKSIFNIVNEDDFVPNLPMSNWSFGKYGRTGIFDVDSNMECRWEKNTGISDYNPDTLGLAETINALGGIMNQRNECNSYTCTCHGDGSSDDISVVNYGISEESRSKAIDKIRQSTLPYCSISKFTDELLFKTRYNFKNCQTPMYFMQVLAEQMSGNIPWYEFITLDIAPKYKEARQKLCISGNPLTGGLEHPHYIDSYYVISEDVYSNYFK